ncbi:unnamed protein product, partial [Cyprideis torosa]
NPLPHEPNPVAVLSTRAKIVICGQAPGNKVHHSGKPFTDPSGDRLRHWMGVDESQFYNPDNFAIVPMGFCFPGYDGKGGDLPPRRECARHWHDRVFSVMPQLQIKLLVGGSAQKWHLKKRCKETVTQTVMAWREYLEAGGPDEMIKFPLPHPSWRNTGWIAKNPWFDNELVPELQEMIQGMLNN